MSNSHRKPTGNQRELSHITKAARKIYMLPGGRGPVALGGICEGQDSHTLESCLGIPSCMLRGPLGQTEEPEGPGLCLQGVCTSWLASNQGGVKSVLMAAISLYFPAQNAHQERLQWCGTKSQRMDPGIKLGLAVQKRP